MLTENPDGLKPLVGTLNVRSEQLDAWFSAEHMPQLVTVAATG